MPLEKYLKSWNFVEKMRGIKCWSNRELCALQNFKKCFGKFRKILQKILFRLSNFDDNIYSYQFCSSPNAATVVTKLNMQMSDIPDKDIGNPNVEVVVVLIIIIAVAVDVSITAIANFWHYCCCFLCDCWNPSRWVQTCVSLPSVLIRHKTGASNMYSDLKFPRQLMYMYLVPVIFITKQATSTSQDIQTYMTIFSNHQFQVPPDDDFKCLMLESVGKEMD